MSERQDHIATLQDLLDHKALSGAQLLALHYALEELQRPAIAIKRSGQEIGHVTAEKLDYAIPLAWPESGKSKNKLFTAKDTSGKALFVVRVSEDKEITTERI